VLGQRGRGSGSHRQSVYGFGPDPQAVGSGGKVGGDRGLATYIGNNRGSISNYGERYRQGETISTAYVESTIHQVVSRRLVKKQQMQWTLKGAHLLFRRGRRFSITNWKTYSGAGSRFRPETQTTSSEHKAA
jgi:hypothetical protein